MGKSLKIQFLWFDGCPSHEAVRRLLDSVLEAKKLNVDVVDINASQPEVAAAQRFPGSPTIRVEGKDIEPGFLDPGDYTPRCRLYMTAAGLQGSPERVWIERAIEAVIRD